MLIVDTLFESQYGYFGHDLGSIHGPHATHFRVWVPTATAVQLLVFAEPYDAEPTSVIAMEPSHSGSWTAQVAGDCHGLIYLYRAEIDGLVRTSIDPYAKASTMNAGRSVVVDMARTNPERWREERPEFSGRPVDAVLYELHTRDFSIAPDSGISARHRGKWMAFTEERTRTPGGAVTGLSAIRDLGVTHVQLLPIFDFGSTDEADASQYNWGYDPVQFNVPDGSYATDAADPFVRIRELKGAVQAFHDHGIRVVMDVVYNHVYDMTTHAFERLVPGYFFRSYPDGSPGNASGCGNEVASERSMVRKYIVDSVVHWAREYHIDGFRFDLMGILDVDTMRAVRHALDDIDPSILVIGEGWTMGDLLPADRKADQPNAERLPRIGQFNDGFRDAIKGSVFRLQSSGYAQGDAGARDGVLDGIVGNVRFTENIGGNWGEIEPGISVNYVEAHDNTTLYDKLVGSLPNASDEEVARVFRLATSIALLAQGMPFLHAGQEFMRTKHGDANSYRSGDLVNAIRWEERAKRAELVAYVRGLIQLRRAHPVFRLPDAAAVRAHLRFLETGSAVIAYALDGAAVGDTWSEVVVVHNPLRERVTVSLPAKALWSFAAEGARVGGQPTRTLAAIGAVEVDPQSTTVLFR